jgi:drug/metabolite transporter (DMT)-like permease
MLPTAVAPSPSPRDRLLPVAAMAVTVLAWASAFVVIRAVGPHISPGALTLGRLSVGVVLLGLLVWRAGWIAPTRREWMLLAGCGVSWFAIYNVALNAAEHHLDAGTAAMLVNIAPVLIALLAALLLGETMNRWLVIGALVSLSGAAVIALAQAPDGAGPRDPVGVLLSLLAAVASAAGVIAQKVALRRLPALQVTWIACSVGALVCLPFAGRLAADVAAAPTRAALGIVYLGAVPTALAFTTWAYALARTPAGRLGVTTYLVPPVTIAIAFLLLAETPLPLQIAGGAICLAGVGLSRLRPARQRR